MTDRERMHRQCVASYGDEIPALAPETPPRECNNDTPDSPGLNRGAGNALWFIFLSFLLTAVIAGIRNFEAGNHKPDALLCVSVLVMAFSGISLTLVWHKE